MISDLLTTLNTNQQAAAQHYEGPALVLAGAGAGKTKTLIHRIAHLIDRGVHPNEILAITFTNKAAAEMRDRAGQLVPGAQDLWISTFHSAGVRILRAYGDRVGLQPGFLIYDDDDQLDLLKDIMEHLIDVPVDASPKTLRSLIDKAKNNLWGPEDLARGVGSSRTVSGFPVQTAVEAYRRYQTRLRSANAIDFSDLLMETVRLFDTCPDVLERIQRRARFIQIDEYQDTNRAQYQFARLLSQSHQNLMAIGDPDQSIYRFRGADIQNILDFQKDYPGAEIYRLEHNYRSSAKVLEVANLLIMHNTERLDKVLRPVKPDGEDIAFHRAADHRFEADYVAQSITLSHAQGRALGDMAILYRTNAQSRVLEEALRRNNIPSRLVGGVGFFDRREIKDILAYVRLSLNPRDEIALRRVLSRPKRGIGEVALNKLVEFAKTAGMSVLEAFGSADQVLERGAQKVREFYDLMLTYAEACELYAPQDIVQLILDSSGYMAFLRTEGQEGKARIENVEELLVALREWSVEHEGLGIAEFLDEAALLASVDDARTKRENSGVPEDAVTLMTLHNAKGLEFKEVFIVGVEENLLPSRNSISEPGGIEEERRLFYVGITRAMDKLTLTAAEARMTYGKTQAVQDSRFLSELDNRYIEVDSYGQVRKGNKVKTQIQSPVVHTRPSSAPTSTEQTVLQFKGGERVRHPKFGEGTVLAVSGFGDKQQVIVAFDQSGSKTLIARFANLTRL